MSSRPESQIARPEVARVTLSVALPRATGVVLAVLALDLARRYLHMGTVDAAGGAAVLTMAARWAGAAAVPAFVLLHGLEVFRRSCSLEPSILSRWLVARGLTLIALELTAVRAAAWFTVDYGEALGVLELLWALGASMIVLAVLVHLPRRDIAIFAALVIGLHNMLDPVEPPGAYGPGTAPGPLGIVWMLLHESGYVFRVAGADGPVIGIAHPVLPFAGIMAAGYALGAVYAWDEARRIVWMRQVGMGMTAAFVVLRALGQYGDPSPWSYGDSVVSFFAATPFPPSLQFLLLALGTLLILLPLFERAPRWTAGFATAGRLPVFCYVLLVFVMHAIAMGVTLAAGRDTAYLFVSQPFMERPPAGAGFGLPAVIACGFVGLVIAYGTCALYAAAARRRYAKTPVIAHRRWWMA